MATTGSASPWAPHIAKMLATPEVKSAFQINESNFPRQRHKRYPPSSHYCATVSFSPPSHRHHHEHPPLSHYNLSKRLFGSVRQSLSLLAPVCVLRNLTTNFSFIQSPNFSLLHLTYLFQPITNILTYLPTLAATVWPLLLFVFGIHFHCLEFRVRYGSYTFL